MSSFIKSFLVAALLLSSNFSVHSRPANVDGDFLSNTTKSWPALQQREQIAIMEQLKKKGRYDLMDQLLQTVEFKGPGAEMQRLFYLGLIYKSRAEYKNTVEIYRKVLASNPGFNRVRLELAHTLYLMKEYTSAKHHFNLVIASSDNKDFQKRIQRFVDAIYRKRNWNVSAHLSLAPSTNINGGTSFEVVTLNGLPFTVDEESRKKSGIGVSAGVHAGYAHPLTDKLDIVVGGGVQTRQFEGEKYDDSTISLEAGPRYRFGNGYLALYATASRRWYAGEDYGIYWGGRLHGTGRITDRRIGSFNLSCNQKDHDIRKYQDGHACDISASVDHFLTSSSFFRVLGGGSVDDNENNFLNYTSGYAGFGVFRELPWGLSLYTEGRFHLFDYEDGNPREDHRYVGRLHLTKRDWNYMGYAPKLQYQYTFNESNVDIHDFDSHSVNLTLTKDF